MSGWLPCAHCELLNSFCSVITGYEGNLVFFLILAGLPFLDIDYYLLLFKGMKALLDSALAFPWHYLDGRCVLEILIP